MLAGDGGSKVVAVAVAAAVAVAVAAAVAAAAAGTGAGGGSAPAGESICAMGDGLVMFGVWAVNDQKRVWGTWSCML